MAGFTKACAKPLDVRSLWRTLWQGENTNRSSENALLHVFIYPLCEIHWRSLLLSSIYHYLHNSAVLASSKCKCGGREHNAPQILVIRKITKTCWGNIFKYCGVFLYVNRIKISLWFMQQLCGKEGWCQIQLSRKDFKSSISKLNMTTHKIHFAFLLMDKIVRILVCL